MKYSCIEQMLHRKFQHDRFQPEHKFVTPECSLISTVKFFDEFKIIKQATDPDTTNGRRFHRKYKIIHKNNPKSMTGAIVANRKIGRSIVLFLRTFSPSGLGDSWLW